MVYYNTTMIICSCAASAAFLYIFPFASVQQNPEDSNQKIILVERSVY